MNFQQSYGNSESKYHEMLTKFKLSFTFSLFLLAVLPKSQEKRIKNTKVRENQEK